MHFWRGRACQAALCVLPAAAHAHLMPPDWVPKRMPSTTAQTCATSWVRSTAFADRREWALFMPPMHSLVGSWHEVAAIGYAANPQTASVTYYFNVTRTDNGGRSFNSVPPLRWVSNAGMWPMAVDVWKDGNKDVGLIAQASRTFANGTVVNELWVYAPWASKWVAHTLELPKDLPGASNPFIKQAAPILNEFFAVGAVFNAAGGSVECIWHWVASIRTTSWTVTAHSVAQVRSDCPETCRHGGKPQLLPPLLPLLPSPPLR
jgi:hypothetical protein